MNEQKIDEVLGELAQLQNEFKQKCQSVFEKLLADAFNQCPDLGSIGWTQYTPYFNDGDTCEFGVENPIYTSVTNIEELETTNPNYIDEDDLPEGSWGYAGYGELPHVAGLGDAVQIIKRVFEEIPNSTFMDMFGDHVIVWAYRTETGIAYATYDFEHD